MAKRIPVIDSDGNYSRRRRGWVRKHELAGEGAWRDGVFVFERHSSRTAGIEPEAPQPPRLSDLLAALPNWPQRQPGRDSRGWSDLGATFLSYPQSEGGRGLRAQHPTLARQGAGLS